MIAAITMIVCGYAMYIGLKYNTIENDMIILRPYAIKSQIVSVIMIFVYCLIVVYHLIMPLSHDMVLFASLLVISRQLFENHKALKSLTKKRKSDVECQIHG